MPSLLRASTARAVRFETGDAMDLRGDLGSFDVVLMANLIDRLWTIRNAVSSGCPIW